MVQLEPICRSTRSPALLDMVAFCFNGRSGAEFLRHAALRRQGQLGCASRLTIANDCLGLRRAMQFAKRPARTRAPWGAGPHGYRERTVANRVHPDANTPNQIEPYSNSSG